MNITLMRLRRLLAAVVLLAMLGSVIPVSADTMYCYLNQKIATRTGPSTSYDEPGTFFRTNYSSTMVEVISRAFNNGVWWAQVEFTYNGKQMRAYTGVKRINGLNLNRIPEETVLGYGTVNRTVWGNYGPGSWYQEAARSVSQGTYCTVWQEENGYVQVEYPYYSGTYTLDRCWIPVSCLDGYNSWGNSGNTGSQWNTVRNGRFWWDVEPEWSYLDVQSAGGNIVQLHIFFYRIADVDGYVTLDSYGSSHGYFTGTINSDSSMRVTGEVWFEENGVSILMNAHQVYDVIEYQLVYRFMLPGWSGNDAAG